MCKCLFKASCAQLGRDLLQLSNYQIGICSGGNYNASSTGNTNRPPPPVGGKLEEVIETWLLVQRLKGTGCRLSGVGPQWPFVVSLGSHREREGEGEEGGGSEVGWRERGGLIRTLEAFRFSFLSAEFAEILFASMTCSYWRKWCFSLIQNFSVPNMCQNKMWNSDFPLQLNTLANTVVQSDRFDLFNSIRYTFWRA